MKYLLDTNVCIRLLKGASASILRRIEHISSDDVIIPSIVRFELYYVWGLQKQPARRNADQT